jgi:hypothetical protein
MLQFQPRHGWPVVTGRGVAKSWPRRNPERVNGHTWPRHVFAGAIAGRGKDEYLYPQDCVPTAQDTAPADIHARGVEIRWVA